MERTVDKHAEFGLPLTDTDTEFLGPWRNGGLGLGVTVCDVTVVVEGLQKYADQIRTSLPFSKWSQTS